MKPDKMYEDLLNLGVRTFTKDGKKGIYVAFQTKAPQKEQGECGVLLYDKQSGKCICRHVIPQENVIGNVRYDFIEDIDPLKISYLFFEGDEIKTDKKAGAYIVSGKYGECKAPDDYRAVPITHSYDWEGVTRPNLTYSESIMYCLHVRGFTVHDSSDVIGRGTFAGIIEKIPYLKELGITTLELQPCYEFDETECVRTVVSKNSEKKYRINYWGYKEGYYYAPKSNYAFAEDSSVEFKDMIKACHRSGLEVIMQFYFPDHVSRAEIPAILRYWSYHYQVDGFHLKGSNLPLQEIISDPYLSEVKLMHHYLPVDSYALNNEAEVKKFAVYDENFMYTMRRFLKGDEGVIRDAAYRIRRNPPKTGVINFFSNYYGFTMMDMVSYNRKHNEANGEDNRDGNDYNFTWNCGEEGVSRKRNVLKLRRKQLHNAFVMLMLSQGTPLLFMGDEFGNSQGGNNNPYCQDNEVTWLNWNDKVENKVLYNFVKSLIAFRRKNQVFRQDRECTMTDFKGCGYPDLSYHNHEAWMPELTDECRHIAYMLCGDYAYDSQGTNWYVAINMHWEPQKFAMPKLPKGFSWEKCLTTESTEELLNYDDAGCGDKMIIVAPRSIAVFCSFK